LVRVTDPRATVVFVRRTFAVDEMESRITVSPINGTPEGFQFVAVNQFASELPIQVFVTGVYPDAVKLLMVDHEVPAIFDARIL